MTFFFPPPNVVRLSDYVGDWRVRLRSAVAKSGKKHSAVARDAGIAPETLSRILNAVHAQPSFDTVVRIARAVGENVGWLLDERGFALSTEEQRQLRKVVRFLDDAVNGASSHRRDTPEPNALPARAPEVEIPRTFGIRGARIAYEVVGDAMIGAGIADGDLLFVKPTRSTREAGGRVVVCRVDGADFVRVLDTRAGRTSLLSRNDRYPPMEIAEGTSQFELIGIVVGRSGTLMG